jgi:Flp pilus assembly protein TadG
MTGRVHRAAGVRGSARLSAARRGERGAVTAETVMVLPVLVALTLGLAWLLSLAATQVRVVDAARETARAAARDDGAGSAAALGRRVAPTGARLSVRDDGQTVVVRVRSTVHGPQGLLGFLPGVDVDAEAVAAKEPG